MERDDILSIIIPVLVVFLMFLGWLYKSVALMTISAFIALFGGFLIAYISYKNEQKGVN